MMITAAVCDDEKTYAEKIVSLAEKYIPECDARCFLSGEELLSSEKSFDILFLDVKMNGINGIDTAKKLRIRGYDGVIIFISGIKDHVFESFDAGAFHYLLKPLDEEKFSAVSERAVSEIMRNSKRKSARLTVRSGGQNLSLCAEDILYLENQMRKIAVRTKDERIIFYGAMKKCEEALGDSFFRCHRGYLVNMEHISRYDSESITLTDGETIFMAKDRYKAFVKAYMRYLRGG